LHIPSNPQLIIEAGVHAVWPVGEPMPFIEGLQTPFPPPPDACSDAAHAMHAPVQDELQQ
jgi:hypothetical protein